MEIIKKQLKTIITSIKQYVDPVRSCTADKGAQCILQAFDTLGIITKKYYTKEEEEEFCAYKDKEIAFVVAYSLKDKTQYYFLTTVWGLVTSLVAQLVPIAASTYTCGTYGDQAAGIMLLLTEMLTLFGTYKSISDGVSNITNEKVIEGYQKTIESFLEDIAGVNVTVEPRERGETMLVTLSPKNKKDEDALKY